MILTQTINSLFDLTVLKKGGGGQEEKKIFECAGLVPSHYFLSSKDVCLQGAACQPSHTFSKSPI